jgi:hypothetical protein
MGSPNRRIAIVVWTGMMVGPILFALVTLAADPRAELRQPELRGLFLWMSAGVVGLGTVLSRVLPPRVGPRGGGASRDALALTRLVLAWAIGEGAVLFPLVARLVTGDGRLLALFAVALASLAALYPSEQRWASHSVQPLPSRGGSRGER